MYIITCQFVLLLLVHFFAIYICKYTFKYDSIHQKFTMTYTIIQ